MATDNGFTTLLKFWKSLNLVTTIPSAGNESAEAVGTGDLVTTTYWLDNLGVIEDTYAITYGTADTVLTEATDYTLDLETSKITLTAQGLSTVSANAIKATYSYNQLNLPNSEALRLVNYAENHFLKQTEMTFADATANDPKYNKVSDEIFQGRFDARWKTFDTAFSPIVDLNTTVSADFVLGSSSIVLVSTTGFPSAGTINIDGNKVVYTAKSGNTLTVPTTTPAINSASVVVGEVIEISKESEGTLPDYTVLNRDEDYKIDMDHGRVELLGNAYFGEFQDTDRYYPANYMMRATYMSAWHEPTKAPEIPDDVEQAVIMLAVNRLMKEAVAKAHATGQNNFNPSLVSVDRSDIDEIIQRYKILNVGTSPFNKQKIS